MLVASFASSPTFRQPRNLSHSNVDHRASIIASNDEWMTTFEHLEYHTSDRPLVTLLDVDPLVVWRIQHFWCSIGEVTNKTLPNRKRNNIDADLRRAKVSNHDLRNISLLDASSSIDDEQVVELDVQVSHSMSIQVIESMKQLQHNQQCLSVLGRWIERHQSILLLLASFLCSSSSSWSNGIT